MWPGCWALAARWAGEGSPEHGLGQGEWGAHPSPTSLVNAIVYEVKMGGCQKSLDEQNSQMRSGLESQPAMSLLSPTLAAGSLQPQPPCPRETRPKAPGASCLLAAEGGEASVSVNPPVSSLFLGVSLCAPGRHHV